MLSCVIDSILSADNGFLFKKKKKWRKSNWLVITDQAKLSFLIPWVVQNVRETRTVLLLWKKIMYFNDFISNLGSFDLLICTDKDLVVPEKWEESGPQFITNSEEVRLRSFTTTIHKVNSVVAYTIPVNDWGWDMDNNVLVTLKCGFPTRSTVVGMFYFIG